MQLRLTALMQKMGVVKCKEKSHFKTARANAPLANNVRLYSILG
jgi:hypothetical protein